MSDGKAGQEVCKDLGEISCYMNDSGGEAVLAAYYQKQGLESIASSINRLSDAVVHGIGQLVEEPVDMERAKTDVAYFCEKFFPDNNLPEFMKSILPGLESEMKSCNNCDHDGSSSSICYSCGDGYPGWAPKHEEPF